MTRKNWALLIILLILSGTYWALLDRKGSISSLEVEEELFSVQDTAAIQRIELQPQGGAPQVLERQGRSWRLNNAFKADPQLVQVLKSVLHNVEVRRPVARSQQEEVIRELQQTGAQVRVYDEGGILQEFYAGGNEEEQISYFMQDGQAYVVELPGYVNYVSGIFNLSESNLRNRTLFSSNFLNLQEVVVNYPDEREDVQITFDGERLEVAGVPQPDSTQLLGFLSLFENLQAVGFVNTQEYPELDSLLNLGPVAEISLKNLQTPEGKRLQLFSVTPDNQYRLAYLPEEQQAVLLDERLARQLLVEREQLRRRTE